MRPRKYLIFALSIILLTNYPSPATAIMNGEIATGDDRVVAIFLNKDRVKGCSGALVAPRIVFTAAHCLFSGDKNKFSEFWVASPGVASPLDRPPNTVRSVEQFYSPLFQPSGCENSGGSVCHGPRYDFAVMVLEKPLSLKTFKIATSEEISSLISNESDVLSIGYGVVSYEDQENGRVDPNPHKTIAKVRKDFIWQGGDQLVTPYLKNMIVQTRLRENVYLGNGDSGSPLWFEKNGDWIYIGALSSSAGPTAQTKPNDPIWSSSYWGTRGTVGPVGAYFTAQAFPDVMETARNYLTDLETKEAVLLKALEDQRVASAKKTIICKKGNTTKRISGIKPTCPRGFTKSS